MSDGDDYREGLLCLGASSFLDSGNLVRSGICLDMPMKPDFLEKEWTRNFLYKTVSIIQLLPNDLLIDEGVHKNLSKNCPNEKSGN